MKFNVPAHPKSGPVAEFEWSTGHVFKNPHSITLHAGSQLLVVADREQQALKLIRAKDGKVLDGDFNCGLGFGPGGGVPYGVRALKHGRKDLLFVASMDNPQDHKNQKISILDVSKLNEAAGAQSACTVIQTLAIDPQEYSGPHLMGVDEMSGDVYAALVSDAPHSTVLRFTMRQY